MKRRLGRIFLLLFLFFVIVLEFLYCLGTYIRDVESVVGERPFMIKKTGEILKLDSKDQRLFDAEVSLSKYRTYYLMPLTIKNLCVEDIDYYDIDIMDEEGYFMRYYMSNYYDRVATNLLNVRTVLPAGMEKTVSYILEVNTEKNSTTIIIGKGEDSSRSFSDCQNTVQINLNSQN